MSQRKEFAERIAAGAAGWVQFMASQGLHSTIRESAAQLTICQIVNATARYQAETSLRPKNWPKKDKKRIDIAVLGRSAGSTGWYGAIELKWPGARMDAALARAQIVEDVVRVSCADTTNLNAKFLILGCTHAALLALFKVHSRSQKKEAQRRATKRLLSFKSGGRGSFSRAALLAAFPHAESRCPPSLRPVVAGHIKTELLAHKRAGLSRKPLGHIYVWQVSRTAR